MTEKKTPKPGRLTAEDARLWEEVRKSARPLHKKTIKSKELTKVRAISPAAKSPPPKQAPRNSAAAATSATPSPTRAAGGAEMDLKTLQKLKRGQLPLEARIDLHGLSQARAQEALVRFLRSCHDQNLRTVLVITGKGGRSASQKEETGGILRARLPEWLKMEPLSRIVLSHSKAKPRHGGEGAFYLRLRKKPAKTGKNI